MTTLDERPICLAFKLAADLADADGVCPITQFPGCWERQLDDSWWIAVNGHREPVNTSTQVEVPPFTMYVMRAGWPAGFIDPFDGTMIGGADAEDALIAALEAAISGGGMG